LDITDDESIRKLVELVKGEQKGVDALINNAGLNVDAQYSLDNVKLTLKTNYYGTLKVRLGRSSGLRLLTL
jgi:NADP-dependent 3-hydroxy acid dehydrogenase YdfG